MYAYLFTFKWFNEFKNDIELSLKLCCLYLSPDKAWHHLFRSKLFCALSHEWQCSPWLTFECIPSYPRWSNMNDESNMNFFQVIESDVALSTLDEEVHLDVHVARLYNYLNFCIGDIYGSYKMEWLGKDWKKNYRIDNVKWTLEEYETFTEMMRSRLRQIAMK